MSLKLYYAQIGRVEVQNQVLVPFESHKFKGIRSTIDKVEAADKLVDYLEGRVNKGEFLLAYNMTPMICFLTHTRPSYSTVYARDDWSLSFREANLKKMIDGGRVPEYAVRMLTTSSGVMWNDGAVLDEKSPLDNFVRSNYYLEKMIFPFQIWKRGFRDNYAILEEWTRVLTYNFSDWSGQETIDARDLAQAIPLMRVFKVDGIFKARRVVSDDGNIIRITSETRSQDGSLDIEIGYLINKDELGLSVTKGKELALVVNGEVSNSLSFARIYIGNSAGGYNNTVLNQTAQRSVIVANKISEGSDEIKFSIRWETS